ncbi:MAG TPA: D-alanyl-D-alanine carboxypeptidase/D-alanyl-D-alanine-endopeptidase, partial [Bacteroidota bacterium]|nr:D-alanyl-D-alanine carboxypeptidase/D-alanyl-D-alanine-endopeptidase [Bacteroidota bacterium]
IVRLDDTLTIAEMNSAKLLHPASNMKLFTTAAALALLPGDFTFRTKVYADAGIDDGDLEGNLYVTGGGDPMLDTLDIDSLAGIVAASGISRIEGDIVGDLSLFDTLSWGKGWMWDDEPDPDAVFVVPLSFNHASVSVIVRPGPRPGAPVGCEVAPAPELFAIDNVTRTLPGGEPDSLVVTRAMGADRVVVRGTMNASAIPETTVFSVRDPALHLLQALRNRLGARGIEVEGGLRTGETMGPVFLGEIGRGLGTVLRRINKISDNLAAESLLKVLGVETAGAPGSSGSGLGAIRAYLVRAGLDPGSLITADGSGVSWYNAVTPDDIIAVLRDQYSRKATFGEFYGSLARAGDDGTLETRMKETPAAGRVVAKTGTLTGVSTISGYITTLSHDLLAFSIMINHFPGKIQRLRSLQDSMLADLVRLDPER